MGWTPIQHFAQPHQIAQITPWESVLAPVSSLFGLTMAPSFFKQLKQQTNDGCQLDYSKLFRSRVRRATHDGEENERDWHGDDCCGDDGSRSHEPNNDSSHGRVLQPDLAYFLSPQLVHPAPTTMQSTASDQEIKLTHLFSLCTPRHKMPQYALHYVRPSVRLSVCNVWTCNSKWKVRECSKLLHVQARNEY